MEVLATGQINKYIAAQGPMQHTCKDFWQVSLRSVPVTSLSLIACCTCSN